MSDQKQQEVKYDEKTGYPLDKETGEVLRPCCVCPDTKMERDECIMEKGQQECVNLIEAHKNCMRDLGFKI